MSDRLLGDWIHEIQEEMSATRHLIEPLERIGKHKWAAQLVEEVAMMREALEALQRLREHHKRRGRPPNWLQTVTERAQRKHAEGQHT